jgi:hypothetical protein
MSAAASHPAPSDPSSSEVTVVLAPRSTPSLALLLALLLATLVMTVTEAMVQAPEEVRRETLAVMHPVHHIGQALENPTGVSGEDARVIARVTDVP